MPTNKIKSNTKTNRYNPPHIQSNSDTPFVEERRQSRASGSEVEIAPLFLEYLIMSHIGAGRLNLAGSAIRLLVELLEDIGCILRYDCNLSERCEALAAQGLKWKNGFGCIVFEFADGSRRVEWGMFHGFVTTMCTLSEVLEAIQLGPERYPETYDEGLVMVEFGGRWVQKRLLAHAPGKH